MLRYIAAEIKQISNNKLLLVSALIYLSFLVFMFIQKAVNVNSGFYQREIVTPYYSLAFNIALLCITGSFFMSIVGGVIGGGFFENNTASIQAISQGRIRLVFSKIMSFFFVVFCFVVLTGSLGILAGIVVNPSFSDMDLLSVSLYLIVGILICALHGILALFFSVIFKKIFIGIIINIVGSFILTFLSGYISFLVKIVNTDYIYTILSKTFTILAEREDIQLMINFQSSFSLALAYVISFSIIAISVLGLIVVSCRREYDV